MKVEFTDDKVNIMKTALDQWGLAAQVGQTVEECAELIVALQKYINRTPSPDALENITDEIADVEMMLAQMRLVFGIDDNTLRKQIEYKFEKLKKYLLNDEINIKKITKYTSDLESEAAAVAALADEIWREHFTPIIGSL